MNVKTNKDNGADVIRILLIEDDDDLSEATAMGLERCGYSVDAVYTGTEALKLLEHERIDLILLDVMLPDIEGQELSREMRSDRIGYVGPIIFMSCLGDSANIVHAFRNGGNDYIVKPAKIEALVERIEKNLANQKSKRPKGKFWYKRFMIDHSKRVVYSVEGGITKEKISLSPTEYNLLMELTTHVGEVILYKQLYKDVWEQDDLGDVRTLMVHVSNLKKKMDFNGTEVISAIRGVGYLFQDI